MYRNPDFLTFQNLGLGRNVRLTLLLNTTRMAESTSEKKKVPESRPSPVWNFLLIFFLLGIIALGVLLAKGIIKLDFIFDDIKFKKEKKIQDSISNDSTNNTNQPDYSIDSGSHSQRDNSPGVLIPGATASPDGKAHVIAGVFYNKLLCDTYCKRLRASGLTPVLISFTSSGGNTFYRVSVFSSQDVEEAKKRSAEISEQHHLSTWVLK